MSDKQGEHTKQFPSVESVFDAQTNVTTLEDIPKSTESKYNIQYQTNDTDSLYIENANYEKTESGLDSASAPENVWIIGDRVNFRFTTENRGSETFEGEPEYYVDFWDDPNAGVVDSDWGFDSSESVKIDSFTFTPDEPIQLAPGESKIIEHEETIPDAISQIRDQYEASLAYTDRIRIGLTALRGQRSSIEDECSTTDLVCLRPENVRIRAGIIEIGSVVFAFLGTIGSIAHLQRLNRSVETAERALISADMASLLALAMKDYRDNAYAEAEVHFNDFLEEAGFSADTATTIGSLLRDSLEKKDAGDTRGAIESLLNAGTELLFAAPDISLRLSALVREVFLFLAGNLANIGDVIPTVARSVVDLGDPSDVLTGNTHRDSNPRQIRGTVVDQSENPVAGASVKIYPRDPRDGPIAPFETQTTDSNGFFRTDATGPTESSLLWFEITDGGSALTDKPISRAYRPDSGIPGHYTYSLHINDLETTSRPELDVNLEIISVSSDAVTFRVTLEVISGVMDVADWNSSGGLHVRLPHGKYRRAELGDFDERYEADQLRKGVSDLSEANIVEFVTGSSHQAGATLTTGELEAKPTNPSAGFKLGYRSWGFDTDQTRIIDGEEVIYISRAPTGPTHNRHLIDDEYTFLNYPVRSRSLLKLSVSATGDTISPGSEATLHVKASEVDQVRVMDLWTDWMVTQVNADGGTFDDQLSSKGQCIFSWGSTQSAVSPELTVSIPSRYIGGTFVVTILGQGPEDTITDSATVTISSPE